MKTINNFIVFFLVCLLFSGCRSPDSKVDTSFDKTPSEISQEIIANAAGYCKAMSEQGADFNICFEKLTGDTIEKLEAKLKNENK